MRPDELADLEAVLRSQLGRATVWWQHDREPTSPTTFVLDRAEKHVGSDFSVVWVAT